MPRGRTQGSVNKARIGRTEWLAKQGIMPLDYLLATLRDTKRPHKDRMTAAIAAAPYCHAKLAQIDTRVWTQMNAGLGDVAIDPAMLSHEERETLRNLMIGQAALAFARDDDDTLEGQLVGRAA